jgi:gluconate 2-dehydrogenase gamma chain
MAKPIDRHAAARREFLWRAAGAAGAAWVGTQWPAIVAAAQHAHHAVSAKASGKFEILTPEQARVVEAIVSQIIPTDDMPGAKEAGVVYFIDRALKTFASDTLEIYQEGLKRTNELISAKYPGAVSFAEATPEQQLAVLAELAGESPSARQRGLGLQPSDSFFETIQMHTVFGFLVDPSAGGNRDYAGWKAVGRDPEHTFSAPYGYYDKGYPGWEAAKAEAERK